ncbi:30S ribosomal protein S3ae [Methanotorris igneus]|uniref:Small ribosomal subunit protein eS1 n=1 Tax=Methanotorris igneus (strain DSM 5666 / JCM 11834 / Kol 5) TaxID=880724 RepID=F6BCL2_METIK|nr:30S ribosomal protein S3ae [Methanotorris igneus]AEF96223.1 30S ribosomal protein S3Ae [Methanotorris igneus Kol 5]
MAKMKARTVKGRKAKDTWKTKVWYNIYTAQEFGGVLIGQTPASDPSLVIGRVAEVSLRDLTNDPTKHMIRVYFKIYGVSGTNAVSQFVGHDTTREYLKSQIRRRRSKIDAIVDVRTKDGYKIRVKAITLTAVRARARQKTAIRKKMMEIIKAMSEEKTFPEYVQAMLMGEMANRIHEECKKIFPLKSVMIYKSEVLEFGKKENEGFVEEAKEEEQKEEVKEEQKEVVEAAE